MNFILDKGKGFKADHVAMKIELKGRSSTTFFFNLLAHENVDVDAIHFLHSKNQNQGEVKKRFQRYQNFSNR